MPYGDQDTVDRLLGMDTWAVVGLSNDPSRAAWGVAAFLQRLGKRVVPVHPSAPTVHGERGYARLADIPFDVDVVDLFVRSTSPNTQVTAVLEVLGADGQPQRYTGANAFTVGTAGTRSLLYRDPMPRGFFEQARPGPAAPETAVRVPVRLLPTDLVVPAGGRLRLTLAGDGAAPKTIVPTGAGARVTVLHDCAGPSALRFLMPDPAAPLLDVRETDQGATLSSAPAVVGDANGGGLAGAPVCGAAPFDPQVVVRTGAGPR